MQIDPRYRLMPWGYGWSSVRRSPRPDRGGPPLPLPAGVGPDRSHRGRPPVDQRTPLCMHPLGLDDAWWMVRQLEERLHRGPERTRQPERYAGRRRRGPSLDGGVRLAADLHGVGQLRLAQVGGAPDIAENVIYKGHRTTGPDASPVPSDAASLPLGRSRAVSGFYVVM